MSKVFLKTYTTASGVSIYQKPKEEPEEKTEEKNNSNSETYRTTTGASIYPDQAVSDAEADTKINSLFSLLEMTDSDNYISFLKSDSTKDGIIQNTMQGEVADCGLLSMINAMSYSPKGREIIQNALEYHDGYTVVHTAVGDYRVDDKTIEEHRANNKVSDGDTDMAILEIAMKKAIEDIINGNLTVSEDAPWEIKSLKEKDLSDPLNSAIDFVMPNAISYLLTGKTGEMSYMGPIEYFGIPPELDRFQNDQNGDYIMIGCSSFCDEEGYTGIVPIYNAEGVMKDVVDTKTGETVQIVNGHAYSVKEVSDEGVTLINPGDTSFSITISKEDFTNLFYIITCDLSDDNPVKNYIK